MIWQKKEEDVLFEPRFIKEFKVFDDISFFNSSKRFIEQKLKMTGIDFFDLDMEKISIQPHDPNLKVKLAFFYLRSVQNVSFIQSYIFNQISINLQKYLQNKKLDE